MRTCNFTTMMNQFNQQANLKVQKFLESKKITSLWHFTDKSNLPSILKHGLLSLENLEKLSIKPEYSGANEFSQTLDYAKNLHRYIHLSFIKDTPMYHIALSEGRIIDPVWIELDISVIFETTTRFCNQYANTTYARIFSISELEKQINFDAMFNSLYFEEQKEARKAEILVYNKITTDKIKRIHNGN